MAYQKGLNKNRNHHDSLSNSGSGRYNYDNRRKNQSSDSLGSILGGLISPYGQGKHSKGGKPKQKHW